MNDQQRPEFSKLMETFDQTVEACKATMQKKNHDYTSGSADPLANFRVSEVLGVPMEKGILIRLMDKLKRIQTFIEKGELQVQNESAVDAIEDGINYLILLRHAFEEARGES